MALITKFVQQKKIDEQTLLREYELFSDGSMIYTKKIVTQEGNTFTHGETQCLLSESPISKAIWEANRREGFRRVQ